MFSDGIMLVWQHQEMKVCLNIKKKQLVINKLFIYLMLNTNVLTLICLTLYKKVYFLMNFF